MNVKYNPFGFSNQTEALLCGVGADNLIEEFKKRDISSKILHRLTKKDFMQLGADEHLAKNMFSTFYIKEKNPSAKLKPHENLPNKIEILKIGKTQFDVVEAFIAYCRLKLQKKSINSFIEPDKALNASKVLCLAADSILKEVNETELKLKELEAVIIMPKSDQKYSYVLYSIPIGGLCIAIYILFKRFSR